MLRLGLLTLTAGVHASPEIDEAGCALQVAEVGRVGDTDTQATAQVAQGDAKGDDELQQQQDAQARSFLDACEEYAMNAAFVTSTSAEMIRMSAGFCRSLLASKSGFPEDQIEQACARGESILSAVQDPLGEKGSIVQSYCEAVLGTGEIGLLQGSWAQGESAAGKHGYYVTHRFEHARSNNMNTGVAAAAALGSEGAERAMGGQAMSSLCFPGDSRVQVKTEDGIKSKMLREVWRGELVRVFDATAQQDGFSKLLLDLHSEEEHSMNATFLKITFAEKALRLTAMHFLHIHGKGFVPAREVQRNDWMWHVPLRGQAQLVQIDSVEEVVGEGLYAPLTWEGSLIVDDVVVSSYIAPPASWLSEVQLMQFVVKLGGWDRLHTLEHLLMLPLRLWHAWGLSQATADVTWFQSFFEPTASNKNFGRTSWHVPKLIDIFGQTSSAFIKAVIV